MYDQCHGIFWFLKYIYIYILSKQLQFKPLVRNLSLYKLPKNRLARQHSTLNSNLLSNMASNWMWDAHSNRLNTTCISIYIYIYIQLVISTFTSNTLHATMASSVGITNLSLYTQNSGKKSQLENTQNPDSRPV